MDELITPGALVETEPSGTPAATGAEAGSETAVEVKDLMKTILGKDFPTNELAIKSLSDTYSYVGTMGQKVKTLETQLEDAKSQAVSPELADKVARLETEVAQATFFAANPTYNTPEAKSLINAFGKNPEEVIKNEVFLKAFDAITKTAEMEQSQSVLHTNPRMGTVQDNMTKASEAQKAGDDAGAHTQATMAVLEAYGLK